MEMHFSSRRDATGVGGRDATGVGGRDATGVGGRDATGVGGGRFFFAHRFS